MIDENGNSVGFFATVRGVKKTVRETGITEGIGYCVTSNENRVEIFENPESRGNTVGFEIVGDKRTGRVFEDTEQIFAYLENGNGKVR